MSSNETIDTLDGDIERDVIHRWNRLLSDAKRAGLQVAYVPNAHCFTLHVGQPARKVGDFKDLAELEAAIYQDAVPPAPQKAPQEAPAVGEPRFVWPGSDDDVAAGSEQPLAAMEALESYGIANTAWASRQLATAIFAEALTWDQQARVLERLGWRRA